MLSQVARFLWGDLTAEEYKRLGLLSFAFLLIIGSYWLLRTIKDAFFDDLVGMSYQPKAKMISLLVIIPLVLGYSKLVDMVEKQTLFYIICSVYVTAFLGIAYFYANPVAGLDVYPFNAVPGRFLGWFSYIAIESFGSMAVALFWSFVNSTLNTAQAKRGNALIISGGQIGAIAGPLVTKYFALALGFPLLIACSAAAIALVPFAITYFSSHFPQAVDVQESKKPKTGLFEGLKLLLTRPYLLGVFAIATIYEVVGTIMDFQLKMLARQSYAKEELASFMGDFGVWSNCMALVLALFGTSFLVRRFGVRFCLVAFPGTVATVLCYVYLNSTLYTVFAAMLTIKALSYALNNPVKELMYIPTSKDAKFKAKGWIDMFGSRSAKAGGSAINDLFSGNLSQLMLYSTTISLGIVGVWIAIAFFVGTSYNKLIKENRIIE